MQPINEMKLEFLSKSSNEAFARTVAATFASQLDPTLEEITDIRTAVSEAVTNAIVHGYENNKKGVIVMTGQLFERGVEFTIIDNGCCIADIDQAMQPLYTSKPETERSGLGFTVMQSFMDKVDVTSEVGGGTSVRLYKSFKSL
jgi:stage II sporulation protein AB (anti-sigma F factor)